MTKKKTKKPNAPELIEDEALDEASGGLLPAVKPSSLKIQTETSYTGYLGGVRVAAGDVNG